MNLLKRRGRLLIADTSETMHPLYASLHDVHDVRYVTTGGKLVECANSQQFNLILLTTALPDLSGLDVCTILKENPHTNHIPIIMLADKNDTEAIKKAYELGAIDHLVKPFSFIELNSKVTTQLALERAQHELKGAQQRELNLFRRIQSFVESADQAEDEQRQQNRNTLLIVDDYIKNVHILKDLLHKDHDVLIATSGAKALSIATKARPDLIILDVMLPDINGYEVLKMLKNQPETAEIPVIFMTALDEAEDEARGLEFGAVDYITKPYNPHVVRARVRTHLELLRHRELLKSLSMTDGLTQIPNRRLYDSMTQREWHRAIREQQPLSMMLIDIDNFKLYNDQYGHLAGDECLKQVAQTLSSSLHRSTDIVARYGGEEFSVTLPNTTHEGAALVGDHLLEAVRKLQIPHLLNLPHGIVTISIGSISCRPTQNASINEVLHQGDVCLYQAKKGGRNRCISSSLLNE